MAHISAVCVLHAMLPEPTNPDGTTAIDKRAIAGPVEVGTLGLAGDRQADTEHHGGDDKAVYVYADEDANRWASDLGRDIPPGLFGENLRTTGVDLSAARIGQRFRVGESVVLEVTAPHAVRHVRPPHGRAAMGAAVHRASRPGAYAGSWSPGAVTAGDEVAPLAAPAHDVTIADVLPPVEPGSFTRLLAAEDAGAVALAEGMSRAALKGAAIRKGAAAGAPSGVRRVPDGASHGALGAPWRCHHNAACTRSVTPMSPNALVRWALTVFSAMSSRRAISRLVSPCPTSARTSRSRAVSSAGRRHPRIGGVGGGRGAGRSGTARRAGPGAPPPGGPRGSHRRSRRGRRP